MSLPSLCKGKNRQGHEWISSSTSMIFPALLFFVPPWLSFLTHRFSFSFERKEKMCEGNERWDKRKSGQAWARRRWEEKGERKKKARLKTRFAREGEPLFFHSLFPPPLRSASPWPSAPTVFPLTSGKPLYKTTKDQRLENENLLGRRQASHYEKQK